MYGWMDKRTLYMESYCTICHCKKNIFSLHQKPILHLVDNCTYGAIAFPCIKCPGCDPDLVLGTACDILYLIFRNLPTQQVQRKKPTSSRFEWKAWVKKVKFNWKSKFLKQITKPEPFTKWTAVITIQTGISFTELLQTHNGFFK